MFTSTLPPPPLPQLMEALLELEAGAAGKAAYGLASAALNAGLPRPGVSDYLVEIVRTAKLLRSHLRSTSPDASLALALLTPDQALAYLYEVELAIPGPIGTLIESNWGNLDDDDHAHLVASTLIAARHLNEQWQSQIGPVRYRSTPA